MTVYAKLLAIQKNTHRLLKELSFHSNPLLKKERLAEGNKLTAHPRACVMRMFVIVTCEWLWHRASVSDCLCAILRK